MIGPRRMSEEPRIKAHGMKPIDEREWLSEFTMIAKIVVTIPRTQLLTLDMKVF